LFLLSALAIPYKHLQTGSELKESSEHKIHSLSLPKQQLLPHTHNKPSTSTSYNGHVQSPPVVRLRYDQIPRVTHFIAPPTNKSILSGVAVRLWQLGIEMRPFFNRSSLWVYPVYAGVGGSFGYWLLGVEQRQVGFLQSRREGLLEKRRRRAQREGLSEDILKDGEPGKTGLGLTEAEGRRTGLGYGKPMGGGGM